MLRAVSLLVGLTFASAAIAAEDYPSRQIRLLVGFAAGGPVDVGARIVADGLSPVLGKPVVVDNRPGAGGNLAADLVAKAPADGYTLLYSSNALAISPGIYAALPFDVLKDFAPITEVSTAPTVLVVHESVPARSLDEFIAYAKSRTDALDYASSGPGTITHLAAALFAREAGFRAQHVPYRGSAPAMTDLVAGRVKFMMAPIGTARPFIGQQLRALATTGLERTESLPGIRTMDELGLRGFEASAWSGMFAPAATPRPLIERLHAAMTQVLREPETVRKLLAQDATPRGTDPDSFRRYVAADVERWIHVAAETNTRVD